MSTGASEISLQQCLEPVKSVELITSGRLSKRGTVGTLSFRNSELLCHVNNSRIVRGRKDGSYRPREKTICLMCKQQRLGCATVCFFVQTGCCHVDLDELQFVSLFKLRAVMSARI